MITLDTYIEKLEKLKQYMDDYINYISDSHCVLDIYFTTGILMYTPYNKKPDFEEYLLMHK